MSSEVMIAVGLGHLPQLSTLPNSVFSNNTRASSYLG